MISMREHESSMFLYNSTSDPLTYCNSGQRFCLPSQDSWHKFAKSLYESDWSTTVPNSVMWKKKTHQHSIQILSVRWDVCRAVKGCDWRNKVLSARQLLKESKIILSWPLAMVKNIVPLFTVLQIRTDVCWIIRMNYDMVDVLFFKDGSEWTLYLSDYWVNQTVLWHRLLEQYWVPLDCWGEWVTKLADVGVGLHG